MDLSHPLRITLCQIIIDRNDMYALSFQRIQISRQCGNKCLTFTGTHFSDTSLVQDNTTNELYPVMLHIQNTFTCLTDCSKCLRQKIIKCLTFRKTLFILFCFAS